MRYRQENDVIQGVGKRLLAMVNRRFGGAFTVKTKSSPRDLVTAVDVAADRLIASAIKKHFPNDGLLTEESNPDEGFDAPRTWVVDPICGSANLANGIRLFVTNVALIESGKPVAAWVIDHAEQRMLWSQGSGLYNGSRKLPRLGSTKGFPIVDVDLGNVFRLPSRVRDAYAALSCEVRFGGKFATVETASSLSFSFVATGQLQGAMVINAKPWDFLAPVFLIAANGGIVTNFDGTQWSIQSKSFIMAGDRRIHRTLLRLVKKCGLERVK